MTGLRVSLFIAADPVADRRRPPRIRRPPGGGTAYRRLLATITPKATPAARDAELARLIDGAKALRPIWGSRCIMGHGLT